MLKHTIKALKPPVEPAQPVGKVKKRYRAGSDEHRQAILDGQLARNPFKVGDSVWVTEYSEVGTVQEIYTNSIKCTWENYRPLFIEVFIEEWNCSVPLHSNDLDWIQ